MFEKKIAGHNKINAVVTSQIKDLCVWAETGKEQR